MNSDDLKEILVSQLHLDEYLCYYAPALRKHLQEECNEYSSCLFAKENDTEKRFVFSFPFDSLDPQEGMLLYITIIEIKPLDNDFEENEPEDYGSWDIFEDQGYAMAYIKNEPLNHFKQEADLGQQLIKAAELKDLKQVQELISRGAPIEAINDDEDPPIAIALEKGAEDIALLMLQKLPKLSHGSYYLCKAAEFGSLNTIHHLLSRGVKVNGVSNKLTPLFYAVANGHLSITTYLVENGATIEVKDEAKVTPIFYAVIHGHLEVVKYLAAQGANLKVRSELSRTTAYGETLLHAAAKSGHAELVEYLLSCNLSLDEFTANNETPLFYAVKANKEQVCKLLISKGASVTARNSSNETLLHYAARNRGTEVLKMLLQYGSPAVAVDDYSTTPLHYVKSVAVAKVLIENGASLHVDSHHNYYCETNGTPLHQAVTTSNTELVDYFLSQGANPNTQSSYDGNTPLHIAVQFSKNVSIVDLLLQNQADPMIRNKNGQTAIDRACESIKVLLTKKR
jgi:ankyrin repeat protein